MASQFQPQHPLTDFAVKGFRNLKDLRLTGLGQVNLVVGKNGVGKSSLLEAIQLYARGAHRSLLYDLVLARHEHHLINNRVNPLLRLFQLEQETIIVGPLEGEPIAIALRKKIKEHEGDEVSDRSQKAETSTNLPESNGTSSVETATEVLF